MSQLVMVIDDDLFIRDLVSALLTDEGWPARAYGSAAAALHDITKGGVVPDLVLLDMRMPGMDGPQFSSALRASGADIPIVVMTAAREARQWAEEIGAVGYLPKPFDIDWLIDAVAGVLGTPEQGGSDAGSADPGSATDMDIRISLGSAIERIRGVLPLPSMPPRPLPLTPG